jgi:hypothetical protein
LGGGRACTLVAATQDVAEDVNVRLEGVMARSIVEKFGPKGEEVKEKWRKLHNHVLDRLVSS